MGGPIFNAVHDFAGLLRNVGQHLHGAAPQGNAANGVPVVAAPIAQVQPAQGNAAAVPVDNLAQLLDGMHIHYDPIEIPEVQLTPINVKKDSVRHVEALLQENVQIFDRCVRIRENQLRQIEAKEKEVNSLGHQIDQLEAENADKSINLTQHPDVARLFEHARHLGIDIPRDHPLAQVGKVQFSPAEVRQLENWVKDAQKQLQNDSKECERKVTRNLELYMKLAEMIMKCDEKQNAAIEKMFRQISGKGSA